MNTGYWPRKRLISVAGMVGIGKTTLAKALAGRMGYRTSLEKVDGNPYLNAFYEDFKRWAFHLQIYFLGERFKEHRQIWESPAGFIQDRSIYEDTDIFARMHFENGNMSRTDYETYTSLFQAMVMAPYFHHPDLLIYLHGSPDAAIRRIRWRGRQAEEGTPAEYWREMHGRYEKWIADFTACPILKIDIDDYDLFDDQASFDRILDSVASALHNPSSAVSKSP